MITKARLLGSFRGGVERVIKEHAEGFVLHACSGQSLLGDLRIDLIQRADIRADVSHLPLRAEVADTVICDPPYNDKFANHYGANVKIRLLVREELVRVCKPNGKIIFLHWFVPYFPRCKIEEIYLVQFGAFQRVRALTVARKVQAEPK